MLNLSKREWILFFAGAEAFHTFSHLIISFTGTLPIHVFSITWGQHMNIASIVVNAVITAALLWWASKVQD